MIKFLSRFMKIIVRDIVQSGHVKLNRVLSHVRSLKCVIDQMM